jgi:hypothetical protein
MAAGGLILGVVGQAFSLYGGLKTAKAEKKAEKLRERQMELESLRKKRENFRQGQIQKAEVISNAVSSGAGESSALAGGIAGITGSVNRNNLAVNQDTEIGHSLFKQSRRAATGRGISGIGEGISAIGSLFGGQGGQMQALGGY